MIARNNSRVTVRCPECGDTKRVPVQPETFDATDGSNSGIVYCGNCKTAMEPVEK